MKFLLVRGTLVSRRSGQLLTEDPILLRVGTLMMEHFVEGMGVWARSNMINIGVPEDVVDMYIERAQRELKDPSHRLNVKAYAAFLPTLIVVGL